MNDITHKKHIRFLTATALFDGHDVAINVIRRILQSSGVEVVHLGHNKSAQEIVKAAIEEDVDGIAISSYQGGHIEFFSYILELLKKNDASHINIFGGGGGVITYDEKVLLESIGVKKIFLPDDGMQLGLENMIKSMISACESIEKKERPKYLNLDAPFSVIARNITILEDKYPSNSYENILNINEHAKDTVPKVISFTGTGGAGKSSLLDETIGHLLRLYPKSKFACIAIDPSKISLKGALLGDRIRSNSSKNERLFFRSMATRRSNASTNESLKNILNYIKKLNFDLIFLETAGIGQGDFDAVNFSDLSVYVMTPEYGAESQLEKIAMLDAADFVVVNKCDKIGAQDAIKQVQKTLLRNKKAFDKDLSSMPVFGTTAHIFNDEKVKLFTYELLKKIGWSFTEEQNKISSISHPNFTTNNNYLADIVKTVKNYHDNTENIASKMKNLESLTECDNILPKDSLREQIKQKINDEIDDETKDSLAVFKESLKKLQEESSQYKVREKIFSVRNYYETLSGLKIPKIAVKNNMTDAESIKFIREENLPGYFPFTAGVFPFRRQEEDATRMFAGEGIAERTNKRFHILAKDHNAKRLSTAFDSVTLYGENPNIRPDIYGKIGNAGVSVCSLDDAKRLYSGFDLTDKKTSVSMTINGPAPSMLAYFFNTAIDFEIEKTIRSQGNFEKIKNKIDDFFNSKNICQPAYRWPLPEGHDGTGLLFLGLPSHLIVDKNFYDNIKSDVLQNVRGTIQADILKEEQAQNTCIFSLYFSLKVLGDIQKYFIDNQIRNFYSLSISGYHIAEAGANPITQTALTLANGFTMLEYFKARGMPIDDVAKNFSFFFSNGIDAEYAVIGRVARRIWAIALKYLYKGNSRSQKLKYHIQTSGRSLHAREMAFNDIRTTLQAFYALSDSCNSLHTNAFDEAITTPTEESVRKAVAIQLIINRELGLLKNENFWQGSFFIEQLTKQVEEAILNIFLAINDRGGVFGAMERGYQRGKIQEESMHYEKQKHSGEIPIIGVNTFLNKNEETTIKEHLLMRSSKEEKDSQVEQVSYLAKLFPNERKKYLDELAYTCANGENIFAKLMQAAPFATIGEITQIFFQNGGEYRRSL